MDNLLKVHRKYMQVTFINSFVYTDPDAKAFLDVAAPYDNTQNQSAINDFVKAYKLAHGVANLSDIGDTAIYLMYGGTEIACCLNLINPSLSNPFNLVKVGLPTFNVNGITTSGTAYLNTNIIPSSNMILNNFSLMAYIRNNLATNAVIGIDSGSNLLELWPRFTDNKSYVSSYDTASRGVGNNNNSTKFFIATRTSSTYLKLFRDNNLIFYKSNANSGGQPSGKLCINYTRIVTTNYYAAYNVSFVAIGLGKTDQQCIDITTAVNNLQTALGRAV